MNELLPLRGTFFFETFITQFLKVTAEQKTTEKIDGAVAIIMTLDRATRCGNTNSASVYDERGILFSSLNKIPKIDIILRENSLSILIFPYLLI